MSESASITGRWRITEMDNWDQEAIDLVQPGFIEFGEDGLGSLGFIVVTGDLDCRDADRDGQPGVEFSWQGSDEGDDASGQLSFLSNCGMLVARRDMMATTTAPAGVVFPPRDLNALLDLGRFLEHHTEPGLLLGPDGEQVPLPAEVYRVLVEVVEAMREGKVITLVPRTQRLTTQEAADFLGVSRPTMVKLLEDGRIPFEQPGRHRRILFTDLLAYTERQHAGRRAALDRMTEDASESGIYGGTPEDYAAALKKARRRAARQEGAS